MILGWSGLVWAGLVSGGLLVRFWGYFAKIWGCFLDGFGVVFWSGLAWSGLGWSGLVWVILSGVWAGLAWSWGDLGEVLA